MGGSLVRKLVKHTKVLCSWPADQPGFGHLLLVQAQPDIGARAARILRKADAAVRQKLGSLDSVNRVVHNVAELLPLVISDGGLEILDFDQALAYEHHLGDIVDAGEPGVADQLRVECQESFWLFRVAGGGGFPFEQASTAVESSDGIDVGHELIASRERAHELDLQIPSGLADADPVVLAKALKELNALLEHLVPAVALGVVQRLVFVLGPLAIKRHGRIFMPEIGAKCLLKGPAEEHGRARVFLLPAV